MASIEFIENCKKRANADRLGQIIVEGQDLPITQSNNLQKFSIDSGCYVDGNIIGSIYVKKLTSQLIASNDIELVDKKIEAQIGVKFSENSTEYVNMGKYTVERPTNEKTANFSRITAYDDLNDKINEKYKCEIDYSKGNKTLSDLYADVCNNLGLIPKNTDFTNSSIPITNNPFTNGERNRTVLQTVAKIAGAWVEVDTDTNEIDLCWLSQSVEPDYTFHLNDYSSLEGGTIICGPINNLVIKNSQVDDENVSTRDEESITKNGEHSIIINEDYILYNSELRQLALTNLWNKIRGMTYVDSKLITYYGKPFLKLGNKIRIFTSETDYFDTYVLKHNFTYDGTFKSIIESPALTKQEIKTKQDIGMQEVLKNTQIIVNKQNQQIQAVVSQTEDQNEKISEVVQTVDEINNKVSNLVDITLTEEDNDGEIEFEGVANSVPLKIIVRPILNNITTLYPNKNIYPTVEYFAGIEGLTPSETLTPKEDLTPKFGIPPQGILYPQKRTMTFENTKTGEMFLYDLPADLLYYNSQFYDEFILDYAEERCVIVKRVGQNSDGTIYVLPAEQVIEYEYPNINLTEGNYIISVGQSPSYISATVLAKNDYTDYFATKVEMHSEISQTANAINLEVSKKLDGEEFTGANIMLEINKDTSQATINADKVSLEGKEIKLTSDNINIESNNFSVDSEGNMICNGATANNLNVNGGDINLKSEGEISKLKIIDFENSNCVSQMSARRWLWEGLNGGVLQIWNVATTPTIGLSSQSGSETTINAMGITTPQVIQTSRKEGKKNFEKFEKALSKIKEVDIYKYNLKGENDEDKKHIGIVIGEEYNYLNDIIATDEDGKEIGVNLYSMISLCLQAIKEQQDVIENLQKRVEKLEKTKKTEVLNENKY